MYSISIVSEEPNQILSLYQRKNILNNKIIEKTLKNNQDS